MVSKFGSDSIDQIDNQNNPPVQKYIPTFIMLDGTSDMKDHVVKYHDTMMTLRILDEKQEAMLCRIFSISLKGSALS